MASKSLKLLKPKDSAELEKQKKEREKKLTSMIIEHWNEEMNFPTHVDVKIEKTFNAINEHQKAKLKKYITIQRAIRVFLKRKNGKMNALIKSLDWEHVEHYNQSFRVKLDRFSSKNVVKILAKVSIRVNASHDELKVSAIDKNPNKKKRFNIATQLVTVNPSIVTYLKKHIEFVKSNLIEIKKDHSS
jgi:hypothetical protein